MTSTNRSRKQPSAGGAGHRPTSLETVCAAVRHRIIAGDYRPGQRLTEDSLAEEHNVSRVPVREALRVLASEGFVRVQPYQGTFVAELSEGEANDLLEVRAALEPLAARLAAVRRTSDHLTELRQIIVEGARASEGRRFDEVGALNGRFHELLGVASANSSLADFIGQLRDKIDWVYSVEVKRRAQDSWREHVDIVDAVARRDADCAERLVHEHIDKATAAYRRRPGNR